MNAKERKQLIINKSINTLITTILATLLLFVFQGLRGTDKAFDKKLEKKASIEYVDKQDEIIKEKCEQFKKTTDEKLDLIILLIQQGDKQ